VALGGARGAGPGQFLEPSGIAVDAQGNVYVADKGNHRIQKFVRVVMSHRIVLPLVRK